MDVRDVSNVSDYVVFMQRIQNIAERASRRKGHMVQDHPPPELLVSNFMMKLFASAIHSGPDDINMIATSQVPAPYTPCARSVSELRPIMISDMRLETHHRGTRTLVRVRTPPQRITAVMAIVEDEQGTAVLLQLYYQPEELVVPAEEILQPDSVCILKEPFFKCATDGSYSLRVDHLSDIIWLEDGDERVPPKWRKPALTLNDNSESIRMQGNDAVQNQSWAVAQRLYSSAIRAAETPKEAELAYLNRSLANLRLGRPERAMSDATKCSDSALPSEKRLFREARALYELGSFEQCLEKLQMLAGSYPENVAMKPEMSRVKARLHEQQTGEYAFRKMYKQARLTPPLVDCATFSAPVEVRQSPGRGRGLFTTMPVSAGQLLVCEKAFAYSYAGDDQPAKRLNVLMNLSTKSMIMGGQAHLLTQIVQKLYHNSQLSPLFGDLHHGDYATVSVSESDGFPVVDSFLVEKIISLNSFGAPRTSRATFSDTMSDHMNMKSGENPGHTTCGIWLLASRINHSCVSNCDRSFIGAMQIVRATRDLQAGTELFFYYWPPVPLESYEEAQKHLSNWGFTCGCELCMDRKATPKATLQRRKVLHGDLKKVLKGHRATNFSKAQRLLKQLEETYPMTEANAVRLELWDPYFALGAYLLSTNQPADAVKMIVKGFEALGYIITACPPIGNAKPPQLKVKRWGIAKDYTPQAFLDLFEAYKKLAPELCPTARQYAEVAYSMVVGERETICDVFPELA
ncbi:Protein unc-45 [Tolypocladium ophioglossoides CBS 100239]|uniref:Protein unc-45 n=1 Tax=Tolypocladium ophioglossoides (strain CBS 100239) TaxID=1163406 RepID=A0A0L0N4D9_TOLOC|nr:Protein unc-45 [Tolypocladium ophioglossoides CBS 100239]